MGNILGSPYLEQAEVKKISEHGEDEDNLKWGVSSMQGWRRNMEDSHVSEGRGVNKHDDVAVFSVFDGHGGREVALYCERHFVDVLLQSENYKNKNYPAAIREVYHKFDTIFDDPSNQAELESLKHPAPMRPPMSADGRIGPSPTNDDTEADSDSMFSNTFPSVSSASQDKENVNSEDLSSASGEVPPEKGDNGSNVSSEEEEPVPGSEVQLRQLLQMFIKMQEKDRETQLQKQQGEAGNSSNMMEVDTPESEETTTTTSTKAIAPATPVASMTEDIEDVEEVRESSNFVANSICQLPEHPIQAGCTAVTCLIDRHNIIVGWAGDSRAVLCKDGVAIPLSNDHKPSSEIERSRIEKAGGYVQEINGHFRVNGNLNLSRALGDMKYKQNKQLGPEAQIVAGDPDITVIKRETGQDFIILACDGIWDVKTNQEAVDFVKKRLEFYGNDRPETLSYIAEEMLDSCCSDDPVITKGLGCDNMTCIIVSLKEAAFDK